ncbi:hypothetical protein OSB04_001839 [Centaurea solstitialis]|uniref:Uncharacterized protein n=1 Tax=Centaurea solstitialis TaxID=347529 RepID=A0AA38TRQ7_9ASTR|nr:hypothetical protein OSB04_001839 [Centaurea solstitialis]
MSTEMESTMEVSNHTDFLMTWKGQKCFKWKKRGSNSKDIVNEPPECSSIFVEPMKWMQAVEEGNTEQKLQCIGCNARLGRLIGQVCNATVEHG